MKIKLIRDAQVLMPAGSIVDVDSKRAAWLISVGLAAPDLDPVIETAAVTPPETAAKKTARKKAAK